MDRTAAVLIVAAAVLESLTDLAFTSDRSSRIRGRIVPAAAGDARMLAQLDDERRRLD